MSRTNRHFSRGWGFALFLSLATIVVYSATNEQVAGLAGRTTSGATCSTRSVEKLARCISSNWQEQINYSEIFASGAQVLIFGEAHGAKAHKIELISIMAELRQAGVTHLVMEQMPTSKQYLTLDYRNHRIDGDQLALEIKNVWGWEPASYVQLIDAAQANDIEVVFMDSDLERVDLSAPDWKERELAAEKRREAHWNDVFAGLFQSNPSARVVVLVGSFHTEVNQQLPPLQEQLAQIGIKSNVITLEGGDFFYRSNVIEAARLANLEGRRFIIATEPTDSPTQSVYDIHLRETAKPLYTERNK